MTTTNNNTNFKENCRFFVKFNNVSTPFSYLNKNLNSASKIENSNYLRPYKKKITLNGLGFKVETSTNVLTFSLGYSSKKIIKVPDYISDIKIKKNVLVLESFDAVLLGIFANEICKLRVPNVYKSKGLLLEGRRINKKEVKKK